MPSESALQYRQAESRIAEALSSVSKDPHPNLTELARRFDVPYDRLRDRYRGRPSRSTRKAAGTKLTELQEREVLKRILQLEPYIVQKIANEILERDYPGDCPPPTVGKRWCGRFIKRYCQQFKASTGDSSSAPPANLSLSSTVQSLSIASIPKRRRKASISHAGGGFQLNRNDVRQFLSDPHSPTPPQALLVSENMFYNIRIYFEKSCRNMTFDEHGNLLTPFGAKWDNALCNDFDSYCFSATMFKAKGLHVEFRRALSKASALVETILRAEHPRTLACFLEVFIHLIQAGLPEVTSSLCDYIKRMSAKVTRKGQPWGQICRLLSELDSKSLLQAMAQLWKCTTDTFDSELGRLSRLAVSIRLDYVKRVVTNHLDEEWLLRDLLAQFGGIPRLPTPRVMLNLAHNLHRQGRHDEAERIALEVLSLLQRDEIYAWRIVEKIESLKIIARSQFNQGKTLAAEQTMREAIQIIVDRWGIQHSWVPEFMSVLEDWLRTWGRNEDADTLRGEIQNLIGKDEVDEYLDVV